MKVTQVTVERKISHNYQGFGMAFSATVEEGESPAEVKEYLHERISEYCEIWLDSPEAQKP